MTREEARKHIMLWVYSLDDMLPKQVMEALTMAADALRPVSRERVEEMWKGEWKCHGDCGVTECPTCGWNIEEYVGDYNFCPNCGAPMTDKAVQMLMERLEALKDG